MMSVTMSIPEAANSVVVIVELVHYNTVAHRARYFPLTRLRSGESHMIRRIVVMLALAAGLLSAKPASAAGSIYLKIPGIKGEVTTKGFEGQIEVFSFSMGAQAPEVARGKNRGLEVCSDLNVMKRADVTSPLLFQHTVFGYFYKTVTLSFVAAVGDTAQPVFELVLNNVAIQSVQESGAAGGDDRPTESVAFKPSSWTLTAWPTGPGGKVGSPVTTTVTCQ